MNKVKTKCSKYHLTTKQNQSNIKSQSNLAVDEKIDLYVIFKKV